MGTVPQTLKPGLPQVSLWQSVSVLLKLRVNFMVAMTAACGAYLGALHTSRQFVSFTTAATLVAVTLAACGTAAINQLMERDVDARMKRTCMRPLITGALSRTQAVAIAAASLLAGLVLLAIAVDFTTAALTLFTSVVYLVAYTPLKLITPICTAIGAIAGAMPPLIGYRALAGRLDAEAVVLFLILFAWQFPHFHSIAMIYRDDYAAARVRMLAVVDRDGRRTQRSIIIWSAILMAVSLAPFIMDFAGPVYASVALVMGAWLLRKSLALTRKDTAAGPREQGRQLLRVTLIYLPVLLLTLVVNARR